MKSLPYWIALIVFTTPFLLIMFRLVFNTRFRKDLISSDKSNTARIGPFSVSGAIIIVLTLILGVGIYWASDKVATTTENKIATKIIPEAEKVIFSYFSFINCAVNGDDSYYQKLWMLYTPKYQEQKKRQHSNYNLPSELNKLYLNSESHELISIYLIGDDRQKDHLDYYVTYRRKEQHIENPYYIDFSPTTLLKTSSIPYLLNPNKIHETIKSILVKYYDIPENYDFNEVYQIIDNRYLNRLISPAFITEIAAFAKLQRKNLPKGSSIGEGENTYYIYEGDRFQLDKLDSGYRISAIKIISYGAYRFGIE